MKNAGWEVHFTRICCAKAIIVRREFYKISVLKVRYCWYPSNVKDECSSFAFSMVVMSRRSGYIVDGRSAQHTETGCLGKTFNSEFN